MLEIFPTEKKYFAFDADGTLIHDEYKVDEQGNHYDVHEEIINFAFMRPILRYMSRHHVLLLATERVYNEHTSNNRQDFLTKTLNEFRQYKIYFKTEAGMRTSEMNDPWGEDKLVYIKEEHKKIKNTNFLQATNLNVRGKNFYILNALLSVGFYPEPDAADDRKENKKNLNYTHEKLRGKNPLSRAQVYLIDDVPRNIEHAKQNGYNAILADTSYAKVERDQNAAAGTGNTYIYQLAMACGLHSYAIDLVDAKLVREIDKDDLIDAIDYLYNSHYEFLTETQKRNLNTYVSSEVFVKNQALVDRLEKKLSDYAKVLGSNSYFIYKAIPEKADLLYDLIKKIKSIPKYNPYSEAEFIIALTWCLTECAKNSTLDKRRNILLPETLFGNAEGSRKIIQECLNLVDEHQKDISRCNKPTLIASPK